MKKFLNRFKFAWKIICGQSVIYRVTSKVSVADFMNSIDLTKTVSLEDCRFPNWK